MKRPFTLVFLWCLFSSAFAQGFKVTVDKQKIFIGEQLNLTIESFLPPANDQAWFSIDSLPHFEILNRSVIDTLKNSSSVSLLQHFVITSWDSGSWQLPSFTYAGSRSAPIKIEVTFSPFDRDQPYHDIKDILEVKKPIESKWYWYLIFAGILLLLFLLFFPIGKKKERPEFETNPGAYKAALKHLEQLKSRPVDDPKEYYTTLIHIFRTYLQQRKNIQSFSKTTDDLAVQINHLNMDSERYRDLLQALRLSDLVKFARYQPAGHDHDAALESIKSGIISIEQSSHGV